MRKLFYLGVAAMMGLASCSTEDSPNPVVDVEEPQPEIEVDITRVDAASNRVMNDFSLDFMRFVSDNSNSNVLVSPSSLSGCLALLANGVNDAARDEMLMALNGDSGEAGLARLNEFWKVQSYRLPKVSEDVDVFVANSLWIKPGYEFNDDYVSVTRDYFKADVFNNYNLEERAGIDFINGWIGEKTSGLIPDMFESPLKGFMAVLVNTLYFKGGWGFPFDKDATAEGAFRNSDGSMSEVEYMFRENMWSGYGRIDNVTYLELPYGEDARYAMIVAMPDEDMPMSEFISTLSADKMAEAGKLPVENFNLKMPKFNVETSYENLKNFLAVKGMGSLLRPGSLTGIIKGDASGFAVDQVLQKNKIAVDETGTVGASATAILIYTSTGEEPKLKEIEINRPFTFWITDKESGLVLFIGSINSIK